MRWTKVFALIQEQVARRKCPCRWSARRRASWPASGGSAAAESLETRCLLAAGGLDPSFGVCRAESRRRWQRAGELWSDETAGLTN